MASVLRWRVARRRRVRSVHLPAFRRRQDPHDLAVLGDRAARDVDALLGQDLGDVLIAERMARDLRPMTMARIRSLTLSAETSSPSVLLRLEVKKYLSSKMPCAVCTYLLAVARLTVDSCMPMSSATSFSTSGLRWAMPRSRKSRWNLTMLVRHHEQRALALLDALDQPGGGAHLVLDVLLGVGAAGAAEHLAIVRADAQARQALLVEGDDVLLADLLHEDVGRDVAHVALAEVAARLGLQRGDVAGGRRPRRRP